ncbi:sigma-70 family RNA polymerase sigma factor [Aquisphaera insulae]|uniref:sigma-70 family RNA polymerase sigma factor n=1 Tax=Aquisphaera insulae TaxID=2712864 RepID=UPI0013EB445E|nr:sigma-70 family RNA polymerase sigma factor [Aquisphaera insulae]
MSDASRVTRELVEQAGEGDAAARQALLERYRDHLCRMVAARLDRRLSPRVDASDVVQETLAVAAGRLDEYLEERPLPFLGWIRGIANERVTYAHRQHLYAQRRSVSRESRGPSLARAEESSVAIVPQLVSPETSPSNNLAHQEIRERLRGAIESLPARDREVLLMRHFEHLDTSEIADALGLAESGVRARYFRALSRLRISLERTDF